MSRCILIALAFALAAVGESHGQTGLLPDGHLDTAALRDAYLQADIPRLRGTLEGFMKSHPQQVDRSERIFTHAYLGAVYAGETGGRALAEGHFRALLRLDPGHDPAALYFPPQVKAMFEAVRAGLAREAANAHPLDPAPNRNASVPATAASQTAYTTAAQPPPAAALREANRPWIWWTLGSAAAVVGAGVGVYALWEANSDPGPRRVDVDATLK